MASCWPFFEPAGNLFVRCDSAHWGCIVSEPCRSVQGTLHVDVPSAFTKDHTAAKHVFLFVRCCDRTISVYLSVHLLGDWRCAFVWPWQQRRLSVSLLSLSLLSLSLLSSLSRLSLSLCLSLLSYLSSPLSPLLSLLSSLSPLTVRQAAEARLSEGHACSSSRHFFTTPTSDQYNHGKFIFRHPSIIDFGGLDGPGGPRNHYNFGTQILPKRSQTIYLTSVF